MTVPQQQKEGRERRDCYLVDAVLMAAQLLDCQASWI